MDPHRDRFLAKVALDEGYLTRQQLRDAFATQKEIGLKGKEVPDIEVVLADQGHLDDQQVQDLRVRTKREYFARLYAKIKLQEEAERANEPPPPAEPETDEVNRNARPTPRRPASRGRGHASGPRPGVRRSRSGHSTRPRPGVRSRSPRGGPTVVLLVVGAILFVVILAGIALSGSSSTSTRDTSSPPPTTAPDEPTSRPSTAPPDPTPESPSRSSNPRPLDRGTGGLFGRTEFEREVENPSVLESVPPPSGSDVLADLEAALAAERWEEAIEICRRFAEQYPDHPWASTMTEMARRLTDPTFQKELREQLERIGE